MKKRLVFIFAFGPALLAYPVGFVVTAWRLAYNQGRDAAVRCLAEELARKTIRRN